MLTFILKHKNSLMWALVILILCGMPPSGLPSIRIPGFDKMVHAGLFGVLALLVVSEQNLLRSRLSVEKKSRRIGFTVAVLYGAAIELMQLWVFTARGAEWLDFIADAIGAGMAVLFYRWFNRVTKGWI